MFMQLIQNCEPDMLFHFWEGWVMIDGIYSFFLSLHVNSHGYG